MTFPLDYDLNEEINGLINEYNDILNEYRELRTFYISKKNYLNDFDTRVKNIYFPKVEFLKKVIKKKILWI